MMYHFIMTNQKNTDMKKAKHFLFGLLAILTLGMSPPGHARQTIPGERILLEATYNTRDLGGYTGAGGKRVVRGKLLRTDEPASLSKKDMAALSALPLVTVIDFRSVAEQQARPDRLPDNIRRYYFLPITPGKLSDLTAEKIDENFMTRMYGELVTDKQALIQYTEFFRILQSDDITPLAFHCAAGKDRTGVAAALILYALGVDEPAIMSDYLLSAGYIQEKYADILKQKPEYAPLLTVKPAYLQAAINMIRNRYGSIENFLENVLQVNISRMREKYLQ